MGSAYQGGGLLGSFSGPCWGLGRLGLRGVVIVTFWGSIWRSSKDYCCIQGALVTRQSKAPGPWNYGPGACCRRGLRGLSGALAALYPPQQILKAFKRQYCAPNAHNPHNVENGQYLHHATPPPARSSLAKARAWALRGWTVRLLLLALLRPRRLSSRAISAIDMS